MLIKSGVLEYIKFDSIIDEPKERKASIMFVTDSYIRYPSRYHYAQQ